MLGSDLALVLLMKAFSMSDVYNILTTGRQQLVAWWDSGKGKSLQSEWT